MQSRHWVEQIIETVGSWDEIDVAAHRFGGSQFNLGKVEIGHIHRHGMVDIPFTRKVREALVAEGLAEHHHLLHDSGWISYYIRAEADIPGALWLYRLSLLLKQRGRARKEPARLAQIQQELAAMQLSGALATVVGTEVEEEA